MSTLPKTRKRRKRKKVPPNFLVEKTNSYVYSNTVFGEGGWACAIKYKPIPYDLVTVLTLEGKEKNGWWSEVFWDGYHIKHTDRIRKWKKASLGSLEL